MKRFLCMLMAAMMICSIAAAEAWQGQIVWETEAAGALQYLSAVSQHDPERLEKLAEALEELAAGLEISYGWQDDGAYVSVSLKDTLLLDLGLYADDQQAAILTNMLPGHYLSVPVQSADATASLEAAERLEGMEWGAIASEALAAVDEWQASLTMTEEYGSFMGDAYDGGVYRKSFRFDDRSVAALVDSLLGVLDKHGVNDELLDDYLGRNALMTDLLRWNKQLGEENRYSYVLHQVYGAQASLIGCSLVVLEAEEQVMSLSLALASNGWRAVWGYGLNGQNYYIGIESIDGEVQGEKHLAIAVYQDPMKVGFLAVESYSGTLLLMVECKITQEDTEQESRWTVETEVLSPMGTLQDSYYVLEGVKQHADGSSRQSLAWYLPEGEKRAQKPMQKITITVEPCEAKAWTTDELTAIDMDDPSDALITDLVEEATQDLLLKLVRLLPAQLWTTLLLQ